jgi:hypothetical protein
MTVPHTNTVLQFFSIRLFNDDGPVNSGLKHVAELNREPNKPEQAFHRYSVSTKLFNKFTVKHNHILCVVNPQSNSSP